MTYCDLEHLGVQHYLVAHVEIVHGIELVIMRRWEWNTVTTDQCT